MTHVLFIVSALVFPMSRNTTCLPCSRRKHQCLQLVGEGTLAYTSSVIMMSHRETTCSRGVLCAS